MNVNSRYLLIAGLCSLALSVLAQPDSIHTEYKTEDQAISRSEIQRVIRYITRANVEEKTLLKVGILPNSVPFTQSGTYNIVGFGSELSGERKLYPSLSMLVGFDNQLLANFRRGSILPQTGSNPYPIWLLDRSFALTSSVKLALRYYYGMARRIRVGKSANNFSGAYVALQARRPVLQYIKTREQELQTGDSRIKTDTAPLGTLNTPSLAIQWGTQQRLGSRGYLDLQVGPELTFLDANRAYNFNNGSRTTLTLRLSAFIGVGW